MRWPVHDGGDDALGELFPAFVFVRVVHCRWVVICRIMHEGPKFRRVATDPQSLKFLRGVLFVATGHREAGALIPNDGRAMD